MLIENSDENKVFNIALNTPPKNSTGVAHILEHSVLSRLQEFPPRILCGTGKGSQYLPQCHMTYRTKPAPL